MGCRENKKSLIEYIDGKLPSEKRERVEAHVASCPSCASELERLSISRKALDSLDRPAMPQASSQRVLDAVLTGDARAPRSSILFRPATAMAAGAVALVALIAILVGLGLSGPGKPTTIPGDVAVKSGDRTSQPVALESQSGNASPSIPKMAGTIVNPVVKATENDYNKDTLRSTFDALPERKQLASSYSMADAVRLSGDYSRQCCDRFAELGEDPNMLRAMITSITFSEPVLLPYYVEKARFTGRGVWIIAFVGPRKAGPAMELSRNEVWVMDPSIFASNPNASYVFFLEQKSE